jgi:TRAP-type mannitol/chloroaromatic compound transport system permease small subunit
METLVRISDALRALVERAGQLAKWLIVPLVAVTIWDVITRKFISLQVAIGSVFGNLLNSTKLQEMEWHLHTALFALCLGFGYIHNAHVRIDLISGGRSPRWRAWIEFLGCVFFLVPYCLVVIYFGYDFALTSYVQGEISASLVGVPHRWIIKSIFLVGMVLALFAGISILLRYFIVLFGPRGAIEPPFEAAKMPEEPVVET